VNERYARHPRRISAVVAREILDCRGLPTIEVDVWIDDAFVGRASAPAGRSTSGHEARERRDGGRRFGGYGVLAAVANVQGEIAKALIGQSAIPQRAVDKLLVELDGSSDKSRLGSNAIVATSIACAKAAAAAVGLPLYRYLNSQAHIIPVPLVNLINGGRHASNDLEFQEFMIIPHGVDTLLEAMAIATEVNLALHDVIVSRYGKIAANLGDEGGYAPPIREPSEALEALHEAAAAAGHRERVTYGLDCASTHIYDHATGRYRLAGRQLDRAEMIGLYERLVRDYDVRTIEDPLQEDDFDGFAELTRRITVQVVGDDLFATNPSRIRKGIDTKAANALLWKVNQIGTLTEAFEAADLARSHGFAIVVSERSGETEDDVLADLAVALNAGQIKTGAPVRGERTSKYNRLLRIAEELGPTATYPQHIF
jgi:enolase